jgi:hypothetical protein
LEDPFPGLVVYLGKPYHSQLLVEQDFATRKKMMV